MSELDKNKDNKINNEIDAAQSDHTENQQENSSADMENDGEMDSNHLAVNDNTNTHLRRLISYNYIEYASYVIKERAIPDIHDGLKPVQRRILWSLHKMDDGKFHKVANIVGHTMQYHPHGDASIYQALVHIANKDYFIERQGNFGNIYTGDSAAAGRYIEARLTPLAKETMFNSDITSFVESYDGRNKEPVYFPAKIPSLLMSGQEGIAPGMTTMILSHNFNELLSAQISILKDKSFDLYPDFIQGGIMNASEYDDGYGKITLRAKIEQDGRKLIIKEIPAMTTTEKLIASVEKAVNKNKLKISSISDYTAEDVEIEIIPARGYSPEKALKALYAYTDCSLTVSSNILVIKDGYPKVMSVSDVLKFNTNALLEYLRWELQIELDRLNESFHDKTLERIFIENRIYKSIEECETYSSVLLEIRKGLEKFKDLLKREITDKDIEKLLAIPIRRISKFDINKNRKDIDDILKNIEKTEKNLNSIKNYTIRYIRSLIKKYGDAYPRHTEIEDFEQIDKKSAALSNIKVGWDRKNCYVGTGIKSEDSVMCSEFDYILGIEKTGKFKIQYIPQKMYVGRLFYFGKYKKDNIFSIIYKEKKRGIYYAKRCCIDKFIRDKQYNILPSGCQLELIITRENSVYECQITKGRKHQPDSIDVDFSTVLMRSVGARGFKLTNKKILKFKYLRQAETISSESEDVSEEHPENTTDESNVAKVKQKKTGLNSKRHNSVKEIDNGEDNISEKTEISIEKHRDNNNEIEEKTELNSSKKPMPAKKKTVKESELEENSESKNDTPPPNKKENKKQEKILEKNDRNEADMKKETTSSENDKDSIDSEDDWGIIQPDLGF
ncbi:MAG TPA: DNA topoisomerase IV subunit A [Victivallales bacterium]|nr:DNA topoisomerase IV subunit A [Victivallales bacterium]